MHKYMPKISRNFVENILIFFFSILFVLKIVVFVFLFIFVFLFVCAGLSFTNWLQFRMFWHRLFNDFIRILFCLSGDLCETNSHYFCTIVFVLLFFFIFPFRRIINYDRDISSLSAIHFVHTLNAIKHNNRNRMHWYLVHVHFDK